MQSSRRRRRPSLCCSLRANWRRWRRSTPTCSRPSSPRSGSASRCYKRFSANIMNWKQIALTGLILNQAYLQRQEIVTGVVELEGITPGGDETPAEQKGVPDFWLNAMKNNEILADEIQKRDEEALKYLADIKWFRIDDLRGFKIEFSFDTNPFFKNSVLTKTYLMINEHDPILEKAIGTEIEWYPGKCLTQKVVPKKSKKGSKNTNPNPITKVEDCKSFFSFFNPLQVPDDDEQIDEDTAEQLQDQMEQDYDIGSTIRDKIIPHAVSWFMGEAQDEDYDATILEFENDNDEEAEGAQQGGAFC